MAHDRVRTNHDELSQIAQLFGQEADAVGKTIQSLRQRQDVLRGGDWVGQAATRFYGEMDADVLPTLVRLQRALTQSQQVMRAIGTRLRQCEADAARQLQDRETFTGQPVGGSGGSLPATDGTFTGQPVGGSGGSLPATDGTFTGQPVGGSGGSLPATDGTFTGQPVGGSGGSLPATDGTFTGQPVGGSGGSLPATDDGYSIGGATSFGPYSASGSLSALDGSLSETGSFGTTAEGQVAGSNLEIGFDPFGFNVAQVSGEGTLLGGEAGFGWGADIKGAALNATGGSLAGEAQFAGGWMTQGVEFEVLSGNVFVGEQEGSYGVGGSLNSASVTGAVVLGGPNLGITFGGEIGGPSAGIQAGLMDGNLAVGGGARLAGISGEVGLNVLGWNIGLGAGADLGDSFGVEIGDKFKVKVGPFSGSLLVGDAQ